MSFRSCLILTLAAIFICLCVSQRPAFSREFLQLRHCGSVNALPIANRIDVQTRRCEAPVERTYTPRYRGIGYEILDSESQACFVPDQEYKLLDEIVGTVLKRVKYNPDLKDTQAKIVQAIEISKTISDTLKERGFALYIPTDTLSDALINRNQPGERERHIFDCDTGSFIFLTVAENLGAPVSLVEISLPSEAGHNYVRWQIDSSTLFDWDMNGQSECATPTNLPNYQGKSMTRTEALGYALTFRAWLWKKQGQYNESLDDYREAMKTYPQAPLSYNNFAWLIATKEVPNRQKLQEAALAAAKQAVSIENLANYLDTLGCVCALMGDYKQAIKYESEAAAKNPHDSSIARRLKWFKSPMPKDCTGEE
jgi:tetratricopeptide (TPR) repeat protein